MTSPEISLVWAGGEHTFKISTIGELKALEQGCKAGCTVVYLRMIGQQWTIDDVATILRVGLMGGGMKEGPATRTVEDALKIASPYTLAVAALRVIQHAMVWDAEEKDDQPGESQAGRATKKRSPRSRTGKPDGHDITVPVQ
jgi:hypothetical protein